VVKAVLTAAGLAVVLAACGGPVASTAPTASPAAPAKKMFPIIAGWAHGKEVRYLLEEMSDPAVAKLMTTKTGFNVPVVASLASVPKEALANLYLFMNGVAGPNPFGFQRNVVDSIPGEPGYSPLWLHAFVKWKDGVTSRELKSQEEILKAASVGEVTLNKSALVVNCPILPDGQDNFPVVSGYAHGSRSTTCCRRSQTRRSPG
jgi:hypothetical protein